MSARRASAPRVYTSIAAVACDLAGSGIARTRLNGEEHYRYRGIDDVLNRLAPLLARHRLCILPRVLERASCERRDETGTLLASVCLKVAFDIVSARDGSVHVMEAYGEALDHGDKATAKAMSAAYKQAMLLAFCIPVAGNEDADAHSHRLVADPGQPDPDQGWDQWSLDIQEMIRVCETGEAVARVQATCRALLRTASRRRPDVYSAIGKAIAGRREALACAAPPKHRKQVNGSAAAELVPHA